MAASLFSRSLTSGLVPHTSLEAVEPEPLVFDLLDGAPLQFGMKGQSQIVVGAEVGQDAAVKLDPAAGKRLHIPQLSQTM